MYCSEALTAAFNIETLLMINAVKSCAELNVHWITDNISPLVIESHCAKLEANKEDWRRYVISLFDASQAKQNQIRESSSKSSSSGTCFEDPVTLSSYSFASIKRSASIDSLDKMLEQSAPETELQIRAEKESMKKL